MPRKRRRRPLATGGADEAFPVEGGNAARLQQHAALAQTIVAQLRGENVAAALGVEVTAYSPLLQLCRRPVEIGVDPQRPLQAHGTTLCVSVRSIGDGARLTIEDGKTGQPKLRRWRGGARSPISAEGEALPTPAGDAAEAMQAR